MPNGRPGDNPLTDIVEHGLAVFGADVDDKIRRLHAEAPRERGLLHDVVWYWPVIDGKPVQVNGLSAILDRLLNHTQALARDSQSQPPAKRHFWPFR